jgi:hypothetical protein
MKWTLLIVALWAGNTVEPISEIETYQTHAECEAAIPKTTERLRTLVADMPEFAGMTLAMNCMLRGKT